MPGASLGQTRSRPPHPGTAHDASSPIYVVREALRLSRQIDIALPIADPPPPAIRPSPMVCHGCSPVEQAMASPAIASRTPTKLPFAISCSDTGWRKTKTRRRNSPKVAGRCRTETF
jgi:hypothetical protein